jgi:hypothetical protein
MDRWMRQTYGALVKLADAREASFANEEGSATARHERLAATLLEEAEAALARAQGNVSSMRRRRFLSIALELCSQIRELTVSEGVTEEAHDIFIAAKQLQDAELVRVRQMIDEESQRWQWCLQGSLQPIKRVISTEWGQPISAEGGGAITPE